MAEETFADGVFDVVDQLLVVEFFDLPFHLSKHRDGKLEDELPFPDQEQVPDGVQAGEVEVVAEDGDEPLDAEELAADLLGLKGGVYVWYVDLHESFHLV